MFVLRGLAGAIEGVLLWITVAMISRTATPERWAGVFFVTQTLAQLLLAIALAVWIMPRMGRQRRLHRHRDLRRGRPARGADRT